MPGAKDVDNEKSKETKNLADDGLLPHGSVGIKNRKLRGYQQLLVCRTLQRRVVPKDLIFF